MQTNFVDKLVADPFELQLIKKDTVLVSLKEIPDEITLSAVKQLTAAIGQIGNGTELKVIIKVVSFNTISEEARVYAASKESHKFTKANAIVINSLATRIGANFFIRFNKPVKPTRVFNTVNDAILWLNETK